VPTVVEFEVGRRVDQESDVSIVYLLLLMVNDGGDKGRVNLNPDVKEDVIRVDVAEVYRCLVQCWQDMVKTTHGS